VKLGLLTLSEGMDVFPHLGVAPSYAFLTDFSFVNYIEHKAEEIIGFYGDREHKGRCRSLSRKRRLNRVFDAMGLCYADRLGSLTSLSADDAAPQGRGHGSQGRRGRAWKMTVGRRMSMAAMESCKRKLHGRGCGLVAFRLHDEALIYKL